MKIALVGPSDDRGIPNFQAERSINFYPEHDGEAVSPARYNYILRQTPGITSLFNFGDFNSGRGAIVYNGISYVVLDNTFVQIEADGFPSYIDLLANQSGPVFMCSGSSGPGTGGIFMTDGINAYYYDTVANIFQQVSYITNSFLPPTPTSCAYLDGYFFLSFANSFTVYYSTDPLNWDALQFFSANTTPDAITGMFGDHEALWIFKKRAVEVWYTAGTNPLEPFQPLSGGVQTKGCEEVNTIVPMNNSFYWLGSDNSGSRMILQANGYTPQAISPDGCQGINYQINTLTTVSDAYAFSHRVGSHEFYVLTFPTENRTFAYDVSTQLWHERASILGYAPSSQFYTPTLKCHRAKNHFYSNGTHYVLDQFSGAIAKYDDNVYTEFGQPLYRERKTSVQDCDMINQAMLPRMQDHDNKLHTYYNLVVNTTQGPGIEGSGQGEDPVIMLTVSKDGGHTWGNVMPRALGKSGVFNHRVKWDRLGQARWLVLDFVITDPINVALLGATMDVEKDSF